MTKEKDTSLKADPSSTAAAARSSSAALSSLDIPQDDCAGPPPTMSMTEDALNLMEKAELVNSNIRPPLPPGMIAAREDADDHEAKRRPQSRLLDQFDDDDEPITHAGAQHEFADDSVKKKLHATDVEDGKVMARPPGPTRGQYAEEMISAPPEESEDDASAAVSAPRTARPAPSARDGQAPVAVQHGLSNEQALEQGQSDSLPIIPEAFLVEETDAPSTNEDLVISGYAEPLLPWHKRRTPRLVFALVCILVMTLAIALGVSLSSEKQIITNTVTEESRDITTVPSFSLAPSTAPTACDLKILTNIQKLELPVLLPSEPKVAIHGKNMAVLVRDEEVYGSPPVTIFYSLVNGDWIRTDVFNEGARYYATGASVAISNRLALVGLPPPDSNGNYVGPPEIIEYEKIDSGVWTKKGNIVGGEEYELSVGLDEDLACVSDDAGTVVVLSNGYEFWRSPPWYNIDAKEGYFEGAECFVSGHTIMSVSTSGNRVYLHVYDPESDTVEPLQEPFRGQIITAAVLSDDYFILSNKTEISSNSSQIFVYKREGKDQPFNYSQSFDFSHNNGDDIKLALAEDLFVVGLNNETRIFFMREGNHWEEAMLLDTSFDDYQVSGRDVVGISNDEVYYFSVEDCLPTSTLTPSVSLAPSTSPPELSLPPSMSNRPSEISSFLPSIVPSITPYPSQLPTVSVAPTTCTNLEIKVVFDEPSDMTWSIERMVDAPLFLSTYHMEGTFLLKSYTSESGAVSYIDEVCLQDGDFVFRIAKNWGATVPNVYFTSNGKRIVPDDWMHCDWEYLETFSFPPKQTFSVRTQAPAETPVPMPTVFRCPDAGYVGCTAIDPMDPQDECDNVGEPCDSDMDGQFCCRDSCARNYCTSKAHQPNDRTSFPTPSPTQESQTSFPTQTFPNSIVGFKCPDASFIGCTAPDPSDPRDECPIVGEPCDNGINGEFCCRDSCRNYCTSKTY
eukprot:CAMPEP_0183719330 /NCGR_PEP_ID=MMETSP0737-20130205/12322_1 /TAXON_ID=385413 /ORGANISM="Thalassiosira miniscula, Strain CCMP1093" /LENGTH=959 /DNA_ID=CAMNT_0025949047 /DNA_START=197 /DNA_END=3076 /DNA_ORIENTATION=-